MQQFYPATFLMLQCNIGMHGANNAIKNNAVLCDFLVGEIHVKITTAHILHLLGESVLSANKLGRGHSRWRPNVNVHTALIPQRQLRGITNFNYGISLAQAFHLQFIRAKR